MSGPVGSQQWMYSSGFYPHEINHSARLDSGALYSRSPSASNADTWTWSAWVKNWGATTGGYLLSSGVSGSREFLIYLDSTHQRINVYQYNGGIDIQVITSMKLRDPTAWYHIVVGYDSTQATASNRVKIYVNGEQQTEFATAQYPAQGLGSRIGTTETQDIGRNAYNQNVYSNFYITEVNYISGSQLAPTSFGETKSGTWIPKKYTGSYGSHDYYLDFATRATDPLDASGNGNNWSSTNVLSTDFMLDSPTNNFATFNILANGSWTGYGSYSEGALQIITPAVGGGNGQCTIGAPSSKSWYYEAYVKASDSNVAVAAGFCNTDAVNQYPTASTTSIFYSSYGGASYLVVNGSNDSSSLGSGVAVGDIIGVSYDGTNVKFYKNNSLIWTKAYDATGLVPYITDGTGSSDRSTILVNFGQDSSFAGNKTAQGNTDANGRGDFYYSPPSGHLALCTANLPDPPAAFDPALDASPQDHFNTLLWSGDNTTRSFTGVGFAPDWVWIKSRSAAAGHNLFDTVRGASKQLRTNSESAENTTNEFGLLTSFNSDGFTTTPGSYSGYESGDVNMSGRTYVGWNWKAGGSSASNTDGTITSTVSANTDAGFSIATYNGSGTVTVGHGLSSTPELVIIKSRDASSGGYWWTGTTVIDGSLDYFQLNGNNAKADSGYSVPTSSVFSNVTFTGSTNQVAYCFHSVEGFSKIGTYIGNGSVLGPIVYTGFRPAWLMIKRISDANDWRIYDNKRSNYNDKTATLYANYNLAEYTSAGANELDTTANGFRIVNSNAGYNASNTSTYLYIAFAEMPFKYANAR